MPTRWLSKRLVLRGRVQGVGCRAQVMAVVESVGHISGWVKNLPDGNVEVVVKGPDWRIKDVEEIFRTGLLPPVRIDQIDVEELPQDFTVLGFVIRR